VYASGLHARRRFRPIRLLPPGRFAAGSPTDEDARRVEGGEEMRGKFRVSAAAISIAAVALVVSMVSVSAARPGLRRIVLSSTRPRTRSWISRPTVIPPATCSRSTMSSSTRRTPTLSAPIRGNASGSRSV
jgi:hypothetical protein